MRLRGASLMQKWKRTAIFTLRFKMLTARTPELSAPKFLLAQNGVRFGKLCSAGRSRSFHSRSRACTTLQLRSTSGKAFYDIAHAPADHSNRRTSPKDYAVWEIHPVNGICVPGAMPQAHMWDNAFGAIIRFAALPDRIRRTSDTRRGYAGHIDGCNSPCIPEARAADRSGAGLFQAMISARGRFFALFSIHAAISSSVAPVATSARKSP